MFALLVATALLNLGCAKSKPAPPSAVFLVVVDTLRPDRLSCYGNSDFATPSIDRLAQEGVVFDNAQSVASWTIPSMGAMMTSLYPTQLGLVEVPGDPGQHYEWRERRDQKKASILHRERSLAEVLRDEGYRTAAFVNQPGLIVGERFAQGFDDWHYPATPDSIRLRRAGEKLRYQPWGPYLQLAGAIDGALIQEFDHWIEGRREEKMFVWLHFLLPHAPYNPPPQFMPHGESQRPRDLYDGEIVYMDRMLEQLFASIRESVGMERSLIILTSDHGEAFGEHGMDEHGHSLHDEVLRVPLLLAGSGLPSGLRVEEATRSIDIFPTVLDLLDIVAPEGRHLEGTSLRPLMAGGAAPRSVYSEAMLYGSTERSLLSDQFKLMYDQQGEQHQLFDLRSDPREEHDIAAREEDRVQKMSTLLSALHSGFETDYQSRLDAPSDEDAISEEEREQRLEALRSLGYVD